MSGNGSGEAEDDAPSFGADFEALLRRVAAPAGADDDERMPVGARVGPYEIERVLGAGGMGVVYRARDLLLGRFAALKLLPGRVAGDPERRQDLLREARIAASLAHPHIATVFGAGHDDGGRPWIAMELVDGVSLRDLLAERERLEVHEMTRIGCAIASALAAAHDAGIVHRDLKPENVMVDRRGAPKVLDFGVARMAGDELAVGVHQRVGTVAYMAPEQLETAHVDDRADVFAIGLVLYEAACGARPYPSEPIERARAIGARDVVPLASRAAVPPALARVVERCLAPRPDDRPSAAEVAAELRGFTDRATTITDGPSVRVAARNNLPVRISSFVGRAQDIAHIQEGLRAGRIVTLVGVGGAGKTRLALEVARSVLTSGFDQVLFLELAPIEDARLIASTVATALELDEGAGPPLDGLAERLGDRRVLVVLDNCEHVVDRAAEVARTLLQVAGLRVLATSREPLQIDGERIYPVPALSAADARCLFIDRARERAPDLRLDATSDDAITAVCERLDGLPLALELAAARVAVLSVPQIAERLNDRFALLTTGPRDAPARHRTLRALLDWSFDLLDERARRVLACCAVFGGSFPLAAVEALCGADALDALGQLVDKSLVVADRARGDVRYRLLETVRAYALERLPDHDAIRDRHAAFYLGMAERAVLRGPDGRAGLALLDVETDNLRTAVDWALGPPGRISLSRPAAANIGMLAILRGRVREGQAQVTRILAAEPSRTAYRAELSILLATLVYNGGDYAGAMPIMEEALAIARELGDVALAHRAAHNLADLLVKANQPARALDVLEQSDAASSPNHLFARIQLARLDGVDAELDDIAVRHAENLEWSSETAYYQGEVALRRGDIARAGDHFRHAFAAAFALRYPTVMLFALWGAANLALARDDFTLAAHLFGAYEGRITWHGLAPLPMFRDRWTEVRTRLDQNLGAATVALAMQTGARWSWDRIAEAVDGTLR